jgi:hypothetical protein
MGVSTVASTEERNLLRSLAGRVREIAHDPGMPARRRMWLDHNRLRPQRPMVLCFPEGAWPELIPDSTLKCTDPVLRQWEWDLRARIYSWDQIGDDNAVEPWFDIRWCVEEGDYGVKIPRHQGDNRGSYIWDPPIKDLDRDLKMLRPREPKVDRAETFRRMQLADEIFGDLLPPRIRGHFWWTMGLTNSAAYLMGLEELMLATYDNPEGLHRLMTFLRDDHMNYITWVEREKLLSPDNENDYTGSGGVAYTDELPGSSEPVPKPVTLHDVWGFGESQETVGISPQQFAEFVLPYQIPLLTKFGLNSYGCCEGMERRIDMVMEKVPNVRRVSVAPLANQEVLAAKLAGRAVFSRKVDPVKVCVGFHEESIRRELRQTLALAGKGSLEFILKDTHTVQNEPWRLRRWVEIAREEVDSYMAKR